MTTIIRLILSVGFVIGCGVSLPRSAAREVRYELTDEVLLNPERGFYEQFTARSEGEPLRLDDLKQLREQNISLLLRLYYLENFRSAELSAQQLELIAADFRTIRKSDCKCVLRFAYSRGLGQPDAPLEIVLKHIQQLKPLLQHNADVIAALQAGFIGAWGEWHTSTNGLETDEARKAIADALLEALPTTRCIQVRTPAYKRTIVGNDSYLTKETAFTGTPQARIGHHNDCFLADETDVGTYDPDRLDWDKRYVEFDTRFVPMGGETCQPSRFTEYGPARAELARMHWTYINRGFNRRVIRQWKQNGLYAEAEKLLGYRLALTSSDCDSSATPGSAWKVKLKLNNLGWAAPINPRDVILVLKSHIGSAAYQVTLPVDARFWLPGEEIVVQFEAGIPQDLPAGEYSAYLKLADPTEHLRNRVEYMIRLANKGLWDPKTGLHDLKQKVTLSQENNIAPYAGEVWFKEIFQEARTPKWAAPPLEQAIVIRDGRTKKVLNWDTFITDLAAADAVFLGESHTDETTHSFQFAVYEALLKVKQGNVVLGLEMFERDVQPQLDDYLAGKINELEFLKSARPWQNYREAYRPFIEHAKQQHVPVLATNFPSPLRRRMMMEGPEILKKLPDAEKSHAPRKLLPNTPAYWKRVDNATRGHQGMMPQETEAERLTSTQSLWDNSMGEACADALDKHPDHLVLHLNGGFHSAHWDGTVHQLKLRKPSAKVKTVAIVPTSNPATTNSDRGAVADYEVSVEARATNLDSGKRTVEVGGALEYRFHLPEGATDDEPVPLLIWLPEDGLTAEEGLEYCRTLVGNDAAIVAIDAPYKFVGDDLAVGRQWYWPDTFSEDVFTVVHGIEEIWAYLARHYPIDPERVIVMGEGAGATVAVLMAVHAERMGVNATAFSPTQYIKLKDVPLPEFSGNDQPPRRKLTVVSEADQKDWWEKELNQYRTSDMECDWRAAEAGSAPDSLRSALVGSAERKVLSEDAPYLVVSNDSPRARHWARLQANWLSDDDHQVVVVDEALAGKKTIATTIDPAKLSAPKVLPQCPGPFGGTTILVLPEQVAPGDLKKWLDLEKKDPLTKASRFHRVRIAEVSGERSLANVLLKLKGENRTNVLIVPAEFFADPATMRSLRDQTCEFENEMTLNWLPGLGGRKGVLE